LEGFSKLRGSWRLSSTSEGGCALYWATVQVAGAFSLAFFVIGSMIFSYQFHDNPAFSRIPAQAAFSQLRD